MWPDWRSKWAVNHSTEGQRNPMLRSLLKKEGLILCEEGQSWGLVLEQVVLVQTGGPVSKLQWASLCSSSAVSPVIIKEWAAYKGKSPQTPELVEALAFREWTCPNLKRLWLGKAVEDKNRRMRAFLACMRSDTPAMLNPANVPTHLMVLCCVLRCVTVHGTKGCYRAGAQSPCSVFWNNDKLPV